MISRRHLHLLIALLLPLMVVRGLLPAGYMAVADGGKLRVVMCSAGLAPPADSGPRDDSNDHRAQDSGGCLFALAATIAPPAPGLITVLPSPDLVQFTSADSLALPPATGPPRLTAARAPPAFRI